MRSRVTQWGIRGIRADLVRTVVPVLLFICPENEFIPPNDKGAGIPQLLVNQPHTTTGGEH